MMPIRHIYSIPVNLQITPTAVSIWAVSQIFHFWTSESLHFRNLKVFHFIYEKMFFMKMLILLERDLLRFFSPSRLILFRNERLGAPKAPNEMFLLDDLVYVEATTGGVLSKHLCQSLFLIELQALAWNFIRKRDSDTGVLPKILRNLYEHIFHWTSLSDCICILQHFLA